MLILKLLAGAAFIGSLVWLIALPDYEPAIATITSLSALLASIVSEKRRRGRARQEQTVSGNGVGIQAGGDISVGDINSTIRTKTDAEQKTEPRSR